MVLLYLIASPFLFAQSNDHFANRALLSGGSVSVTADNSAATTEPGEPINTTVLGKTLWWTWTAPASGWVHVNIAPEGLLSAYNFYTTLWRGDSLTTLTRLAAVTNQGPSFPTNHCSSTGPCQLPIAGNLYVQAGETVQISVAAARTTGTNYSARPFRLTLDLSTLTLRSPAHETVLAGPTNLLALVDPPHPLAEGSISNLTFYYFLTNGTYGLRYGGGAIAATGTLQVAFSEFAPYDYWFYAQARNEAGRLVSTPSHFVRVRPRNDHFHEATVINSLPFYGVFYLENATGEPDEPVLTNQLMSASVWWRWTAPTNGELVVSCAMPTGVYTGDSLDSLVERTAGRGPLRLSVDAGITYYFKVASGTPASGTPSQPIRPTFEVHLVPSNDDFADRAVLTGPTLVIYGDATFATREAFEPGVSADSRTLWWSWTAPADGLVNIRSVMFRNVECSVWTGDGLTNLAHVATGSFGSYLPNPWPPLYSNPILRCEVEAGQTYHLRFSMGLANQSDFGFSLDLCSMQITNPLPGLFNGPTNMAIEVTAPRSDIEGTVTGMMVGIGAGSIYGYRGSYATPLSGAGPFTGTITNLLPGVYSLIAWGTNSAGRLISTRSVPVHVAPLNDNFASARAITGWITNEQFRMDGSSMEPGEPDINGLTNAASLWWKWIAASNSTVLIHSYEIPISVFEGDSLASLHLVGSSLPHVVRLNAVIGTTYYIRAAASLYEGPGFLHVSSPVANDDFANSILLSGNDVTFVVTNAAASIEAGEPAHDDEFSGPRGSLWWHFFAGAKGVLILERVFEISVDVFSGTGFSDLIRQPPLSTTSLPSATAYRVRENQRINFAFDFPYHWAANRSLRLRFIPDPPEHKVAIIQLSRDESCFALQAEIGEVITIEASADLKNWFVVGSAIATETVVYLGSPFAVDDNYMFFRAVRRPPSAQ